MRLLLLFILTPILAFAQNCEAFLFEGDTLKCDACKAAEARGGHYQYSREYQEAFDEAIAIDPNYGYAYVHKSVAYLKSGDFITWKKLIDKAVELLPEEYLAYRGWCSYQFFRDYQGCIDDIERFDELVDYDIGYSQNGTYHLNIAKALCYKAIGQSDSAIAIIEKQLADSTFSPGAYDLYHLSVLYNERNTESDWAHSIQLNKQQQAINPLAENLFIWGMNLYGLGKKDEAKTKLQEAIAAYKKGEFIYDNYTENMDKIYLKDIKVALATMGGPPVTR